MKAENRVKDLIEAAGSLHWRMIKNWLAQLLEDQMVIVMSRKRERRSKFGARSNSRHKKEVGKEGKVNINTIQQPVLKN